MSTTSTDSEDETGFYSAPQAETAQEIDDDEEDLDDLLDYGLTFSRIQSSVQNNRYEGITKIERMVRNYRDFDDPVVSEFGVVAGQVVGIVKQSSFAACDSRETQMWADREIISMLAISVLACLAGVGTLLYRLLIR